MCNEFTECLSSMRVSNRSIPPSEAFTSRLGAWVIWSRPSARSTAWRPWWEVGGCASFLYMCLYGVCCCCMFVFCWAQGAAPLRPTGTRCSVPRSLFELMCVLVVFVDCCMLFVSVPRSLETKFLPGSPFQSGNSTQPHAPGSPGEKSPEDPGFLVQR